MIKKYFFIAFFLVSSLTIAQKALRIGYIDMEYILANVPEYQEAQARLNDKVLGWQKKLDEMEIEVLKMEAEFANEKALLTSEMIAEREEDIDIKREELRRLQGAYFGPSGDLYQMRKQFVKPVQDQVFNAVQDIAERKQYDFIFDKSSDLIMLYSNDKHDVSELVLNAIVKDRKQRVLAENRQVRIDKANASKQPIEAEQLNDEEPAEDIPTDVENAVDTEGKTEEQIKLEEKAAKQAALKARIKEQQEAREQLRDSLKRVAEERRAQKLKEIEERNKQREELKEKNN